MSKLWVFCGAQRLLSNVAEHQMGLRLPILLRANFFFLCVVPPRCFQNYVTSLRQNVLFYSSSLSYNLQAFTSYLDEKFYNRDHVVFLQTWQGFLFTGHLEIMVMMATSESIDSVREGFLRSCTARFINSSGQPRETWPSQLSIGQARSSLKDVGIQDVFTSLSVGSSNQGSLWNHSTVRRHCMGGRSRSEAHDLEGLKLYGMYVLIWPYMNCIQTSVSLFLDFR